MVQTGRCLLALRFGLRGNTAAVSTTMDAWGALPGGSGWYGGSGPGSAPHEADATILWFDMGTARGTMRTDEGQTITFARHELPPGLRDGDPRGVSGRRVRVADFGLEDAPGGSSAPVDTPEQGMRLAPGFGAPLSTFGGYRPLPTVGPRWRTGSSEEQTSASPAGGTSGAQTQDDASEVGVAEPPSPGAGSAASGGLPAGQVTRGFLGLSWCGAAGCQPSV